MAATGVQASGGSGVTPAPPYWTDGTHFYNADGFTVTKPPSSPTWINSVAPASYTVGTNGNAVVVSNATSTDYFMTLTGSTSVTVVAQASNNQTRGASKTTQWGIWMYDSTNSKIYDCDFAIESIGGVTGDPVGYFTVPTSFTYTGSGSPSGASGGSPFVLPTLAGWGSFVYYKVTKVSTTLTFAVSIDGGQTYQTFFTNTGVGTIASGGIHIYDGGAVVNLSVLSLNVQ